LKCLIVAAGMGKRLSGRAESKPLLEVGGRPLIEWVIRGGLQAGVREFVVVTGYARKKVEGHLSALAPERGISVSFVRNDEWEKENGLSVFKARNEAGDKFILSMSDHIFDPEILRDLAEQPIRADETILAVDACVRDNAYVDLEDVTKVRVEDGRISAIGKDIEDYNAFDTGLFLGTPALFAALEESQKQGDFTLSGGMKVLAAKGKARVMDIGGRFWIDVDDEKAMEKAEGLLKAGTSETAKGRT
jgi:choline kinase